MNRLARILWKRDRQGFVEEANDLGVAAISIRDLQEGDPFELAENIQANNVGVEALDTLEVLDAKNCLTQGPMRGFIGPSLKRPNAAVSGARGASAQALSYLVVSWSHIFGTQARTLAILASIRGPISSLS